MPGFFGDMAEDMGPIIKAAMSEVQEFFHTDGHETLMRRFAKQYGTLSIEDIAEIQAALGHDDEEDKPCKVCQIMAAKEVQMSQEE